MRWARVLCAVLATAPCGCGGAPASPGGASDGLVFVRSAGSSTDLWRARLSDGAVERITDLPDGDEVWPYWSGAARRVVFQVGGSARTQQTDLWLWDPETGEAAPLLATPGRDERWQTWSPDGRQLVYAFRGGGVPGGIASLDVTTGRETLLARADREGFYIRPSFSPDGRRLVAQRRENAAGRSNLRILEAGRDPRPLTRDPDWFDMKPWFTRDGAQVVYSRRRTAGGPREIATVEPGGEPRSLVAREGDSDDHSGRPSPTRDEIAFVSNRGGDYDLFLADRDGTGVRRLAGERGRDEFAPRWSPDGERVVVTSDLAPGAGARPVDRFGMSDPRIQVFDREGQKLFETEGLMPDWMPPWP